jgi:hypothetical protein
LVAIRKNFDRKMIDDNSGAYRINKGWKSEEVNIPALLELLHDMSKL